MKKQVVNRFRVIFFLLMYLKNTVYCYIWLMRIIFTKKQQPCICFITIFVSDERRVDGVKHSLKFRCTNKKWVKLISEYYLIIHAIK